MHLQERNLVTIPLRARNKAVTVNSMRILRRFEYDSTIVRSAVVAEDSRCKDGSALIFVKGDTSTIQHLMRQDALPSGYSKVRLYAAFHKWFAMHVCQLLLDSPHQKCSCSA